MFCQGLDNRIVRTPFDGRLVDAYFEGSVSELLYRFPSGVRFDNDADFHKNVLPLFVAVKNHSDFLDSDEPFRHHFVQLRKKAVNLFLCINDLNDHGEVFR